MFRARRAGPGRAGPSRRLTLLGAALASAASPNAAGQVDASRIDDTPRLFATVHVAGAGESVEHAPNIGGGHHATPERRRRYAETGLGIGWAPTGRLELEASVARRQLHFLRDAYELDGWSASATLHLAPDRAGVAADLVLGVAGNASDSLDKNSWTRIEGALLTDARLLDARDRTVHADLSLIVPLGRGLMLHGLSGVGRATASHAALAGTGTDPRGCEHAFEFDAGGGNLEQLGPCGDTLAFSRSYADEAAVDAQFGLAPSTDLAWEGDFWRIGGGLGLSAGRFDATLDVRWRRWLDNELMTSLRERGEGPITATRTARLGLGWRASRSVRLVAETAWRSAPLLNEVPVLYNALSVGRYRGTALTFSLGVRVAFGR